ncbi:phosphoglycerate kinase [Candidatus Parcubacteria bacterium]|nr:phosphoglycerate kinase [Candidatus Parcubacteria bacterium]
MKSIREATDLNGKRVLVRVDWNVPIENGQVLDDFRIKRSMPTLELLKSAGSEVIIATHLEPETASVESLRQFVPEGMEILENLRNNPGERSNDPEFAKTLASRADIYVNEAFSSSHRKHASIVGVAKFLPSYAGLEFIEEMDNLSRSFNPPHPFLLILGGAKFETKIPLVEKFLNIADQIFIVGANAKPASTMPIGKNPKVLLPLGDVAALDADDENIFMIKEKINNSNFIVWNGPLGKYEDGYKEGTKKLAQALAESGKEVIIGGADTLAVIKDLNIYDRFSFVSTGGGAMLDFLATGTLPGIEALKS